MAHPTPPNNKNKQQTDTPADAQRELADRISASPYDGVVAGYLPHDAWLVLLPPAGAAELSAALERPAAAWRGLKHALVEFEARHKVAPEWAPVLEALEEQRRRLSAGDDQQQQPLGRRRGDEQAAASSDPLAAALSALTGLAEWAATAWVDVAAAAGFGPPARHPHSPERHAWASDPRLVTEHEVLRDLKVLREPLPGAAAAAAGSAAAEDDSASTPANAARLLLPRAVPRAVPHRQRLVIAVHVAPCPRHAAMLAAAAAADATTTHDPAAAAAEDWRGPLAALARDPRGCGPPRVLPLQGPGGVKAVWADGRNGTLSAASPAPASSEFSVSACPQDLPHVLKWLSRHPAVHYLHPRGRTELQSNSVATAIMQGGDMASLLAQASSSGTTATASAPSEHPAWAAGLTGAGQILGIGDSGIDTSSCYFNDPAVPFVPSALPIDPATRARVFISATHRKLAYYLGAGGGDALDNVGHGTHTAGSLAGSRLDGKIDVATGAAPAARVAFMDLTADDSGDVSAPDDLGEGYFSRTYAQGARVHSDSWGSNLVFYDGAAASLDRWTHEHDDFVSVVAAGNYGREQRFNSTVTSPATSKNCVAVGATLNLQAGPGEPPRVPVFRAEFTIRHADSSSAQRVAYYLTQASFGADAAQALVAARAGAPPLPVLRAEPRDGCSASLKPVPPAGAGAGAALPDEFVLLLDRGTCNFFDKAKHAQAAGAKAVIIANTLPEGYFTLEAPDGELQAAPINIAVFGAPLGVGAVLRAALAEPGTLLDSAFLSAPAEAFQALPSYENIAQYSSFGPTRPDGRVKPDVVAPGGLVSAAGGPRLVAALAAGGGAGAGQCATAYEQGTSMATPVVAGTLALIRQFFTDGYYPAGSKGAGVAYANPSGYLLKAVLLGGASAMQGLSEARLPLEPAPSFRQGFGRVNLTRALALGGGNGARLQVVDRAELASGESHTYCITATGSGSGALSVTLAWYDPPALPSAAKPLVNDLDLSVRVAAFGGALARGNGAQPGPDTVNTVERVSLEGLPPGPVSITVQASRVFPAGGKQAYALVVQGKFSGVLASAANPDPAGQGARADGGAASCLDLAPPLAPEPAAVESPAAVPAAAVGSQAPVPEGQKQLAADATAEEEEEQAEAEEAPAAPQEAGTPAPPPARTRRRRRSSPAPPGTELGYSAAAKPKPTDQDVLSSMMSSGSG
jgi:subtilisin family serine protease